MASNTAKKKTTAGRKTAGGNASPSKNLSRDRTSGSSRQKKSAAVTAKSAQERPLGPDQSNPLILREAVIWLLLAVCILIFISYFGIGGYIGTIVSDISFGVFGITAYVFPVLLFVAATFLISNKGSRIAGLKFSSALGLYLCICSFASLLTDQHDTVFNFTELYEMSAAKKSGGGVIGGAICRLLSPALGDIGAGLTLLILAIVFFILMTQKSLIRGVKRQSSRVYRTAKESGARMREAHRQERARREEWLFHERNMERMRGHSAAEDEFAQQGTQPPGQYSLPGQGTVPATYSRARHQGMARTQIDVPVLFPAHSRESRTDRRINGVMADTKLHGSHNKVGAEIHEIVPPHSSKMEADEEAFGAQTSYIDLEQISTSQGQSAPEEHADSDTSGLEVYRETQELQIEGIEESMEDTSEEETETDASLQMQETDQTDTEREEAQEHHPQTERTEEKSGTSRKNPRSSQKEIDEGIASVEADMAKTAEAVRPKYISPPLRLLKKGKGSSGGNQKQEIQKTAAKLQQTLDSFGVRVTVTNVSCGPSVTRYELLPEQGVKVSRIVSLADDIKLNLAAADIRIEAPIPGKAAVGIEVPNAKSSAVSLRDLLESDEFKNHPSRLAFATGKDIGGKVVVSDIAKMPHLLIAGATGSGKSVCINTLIMSILYKANPDEVKLIMIDPKVVELSVYNGIPHLFIPVVTDPKKAAGALNWGVVEMTDRYNKFAEFGVRDLKGYNKKIESLKDIEDENKPKKLPQIVIIVDELADLMMVAPGEVEDSICRLAQLARAAGIHLIIATQRPSVNVITGLIKANMPSRIAFSVTSNVDSRTIIDMAGAEKLLGKGDMLFYPQGYQKPARMQGAFVSDEEVADVVDFLKNKNTDISYSAEIEDQIAKIHSTAASSAGGEDNDALFADAGKFIIEKDKASIGMLQRVFKIGFNRAARIMDQLSEAGVVGPEEGTKPRKILMSAEQFENYLEND